MRVVVVGGGIAGLAAARRLEALAPDAEVTLVERESELGGKLRTEHVDGFVVEGAPDSFLSRKERGVGLCAELGLEDELIGRRPEHRRSFVRRGDELHPLPEGLTGMIPTSLEALETTELLSPEGKSRFAAEVDVPARHGREDESIGAFVSRRFGREAYEALVEPLMTGIYGGDGDLLSLQATFPQLRVLELEYGSLLRGLSAPPASDLPPFVSLRGGMSALVSALRDSFERTRIEVGRAAVRVSRRDAGFAVELDGGDTVEADGIVIATPAFVTAELAADLDPELAAAHAEIPYASSVGRHARLLARRRRPARRLRLRRSACGWKRRAGLHLVIAEVGGACAGRLRPAAGLRGSVRRARRHGGRGRRPGRARSP